MCHIAAFCGDIMQGEISGHKTARSGLERSSNSVFPMPGGIIGSDIVRASNLLSQP